MAITQQRYTLADLLAMPSDGRRYELLGGELAVFSSPDEFHASIVTELMGFLYLAQEAGFGAVRTAPRAVALDFPRRGLAAQDVTFPDLLFVRADRAALLGTRFVEGVPDLIIEVLSPTTEEDDLPGGAKWEAYERNAVPHYWIVDPDMRAIAQYEFREGRLVEDARLHPSDVLTSPLFPGITREVARVFAYVRGPRVRRPRRPRGDEGVPGR